MAWSIEGEYMENCNCEVVCPCITSSIAGPADNERSGVPTTYTCDGTERGAEVPGSMGCGIERVTKPETGEVIEVPNTIQPMGSNLPIAKSVKGTFDDFGLSFDNTGKNGHYREFAWS